ncbi:Spx/MgsR family RNA polymerase-binding regulatory protein [Leptospira sp. 2 VSF19]|uniref:Spx/MgsR family RNA polymerase-binding regulatory protein n=1 Tax=Leptospira soteropolitanensis TaxID=2950025 RepID=A0AAW5VD12_9LEPT|nr:Spx/MgsR family RNA polymerase-binding regulatory protein [Leptospira soteropolitanensis]MCW7491449.1 Spx/MgsR family RNA polymerase-binding regulatory protein [Leptospira soteropolitanensis]MCW7499033.1 Spx/MgsR family RNA polymerase-binding regulatory protein [Leptospira soteropolitanensis]MCW7521375.1 Spx/MgsR family RNA polymerase-binding regulatory protein [Leptospira soteropolitanensis]MCW7525137.1 Spx/MgsR family RNA polymerase-binding regulatory protein [Leptospira soteropolitanensis
MSRSNPKVYEYSGCSTCRNALKYLKSKKVDFQQVPIRDNPPSVIELKKAKQYLGDIKKLFNTSGKDYREGNWKEKLTTFTEDQIYKELSNNGNLVKRPFVVGDGWYLVGFKEEEWKEKIG